MTFWTIKISASSTRFAPLIYGEVGQVKNQLIASIMRRKLLMASLFRRVIHAWPNKFSFPFLAPNLVGLINVDLAE